MDRKKLLIGFALFGIIATGVLFGAYKMRFLDYPYNLVRPLLLSGGGSQCLNALNKAGIEYRKLGDTRDEKCLIINAVNIRHFPNTMLSGSITVSCPTALNLELFFDEISAKNVTHLGSYNCREQRGNSVISEHGYGTAIDISVIDGASLLDDWKNTGEKGQILRKAHRSACKYFSNVLTPDSNAAHKNHFHLDNGLGLGCR